MQSEAGAIAAVHGALQTGALSFVEANWISHSRNVGVTMNGVTHYQEGARNLGELKVGLEGQLNKNLHLWGNVAQQVGDKGYSDTQGILGVKYGF
jgi:autotransporter family porin